VSWRFALTPKWIIRHVLVVALVATMIALGFWQLRRLDEKSTYKHLVEARQEQPVVEVTDLLPVDAAVDDEAVDAVLYRSVRSTGTYADDDTVVVENRTLNGAPGGWVLTPLRLDDGPVVIVNRGFVGFDRDGAIVAPPAPSGTVQVEGLVFPSQRRGSFGPADRCAGEVLVRVDLDCYATRLGYDVLPAWVQLVTSDPAEPAPARDAPALLALGPPTPDEGPHLSYAVQWFIFSTIAAGGYVLLLRKVALDTQPV
jgi:cytochrome oxidase assembly protein ShyY1